ncbi:MAG: NPCBM/NEW2 domain-containing protein [Thermogutta sp.]|uniref:NPCBM/NEW2 domain-containing protein n=1 Tax=Thermogutta sp. TaxID=1962930 RepID=UPI0019C67EA1|nr:NPCBM/NEW2 domain-containing protein [Thermogutta sp.]MBC7352895.1 NPCBM/NEW2 domain-containing protein [Thermogutta sp.]
MIAKRRPLCGAVAWVFIAAAALGTLPEAALGWSSGHAAITQGAVAALPSWEREWLGEEGARLASEYCYIPDLVYSKPEIRPYAMLPSRPKDFYLVELHLPPDAAQGYELLRHFLGQAVEKLRAGDVADGSRFLGTLVHTLEDWGCPAHSVPGDNMFTLMRQFVLPPEGSDYRYVPMHGPMESAQFIVDLGSYQPRLLGTSVDEAAFHLLGRVQEAIVFARSQVIPIMQALYADDQPAATLAQQKAGVFVGRVVADALHTALSLARQQFDDDAVRPLREVDLSSRMPLEATNLAWPQSAFFSKPYWGHPTVGVVLKDGKKPTAIRMQIPDCAWARGPINDAIAVGTPTTLTYLIPPGVYDRLEVWAGLHAELGLAGDVIFEIRGNDGKVLVQKKIQGKEPAQLLVVPLAEEERIQLVTRPASRDASANYAIWARPRLLKSSD